MISSNTRFSLFWGIWSVILLVSGFQLYRDVQKLSDAAGWVAHTHEVMEATQSTLMTLVDAEAHQRVYLITNDPDSLAPYQADLTKLQGNMTRLENLVRDNPMQQSRVRGLKTLVAVRLNELQGELSAYAKYPANIRQALVAEQARRTMPIIRDDFEAMWSEELALLSAREQLNQRAYHGALLAEFASATLGIIGLSGLLLLVLKANRDRDRYEMERDLQRQLLIVTLRSLGDALLTTNTAGAVEFMNPVAESLTGWKLEEAVKHPLNKVMHLVHEETREAVVLPQSRILREGTVTSLADRTVLIARDGREIPIDDSASPIKNETGKVLGMALVFRDVTERRKAEQDLAKSELRFRKLTELSPIAIWVNRNDRVELANPEACRLMRAQDPAALEGRSVFDVWHPDCYQTVEEREKEGRAGRAVHGSEEILVRLDGSLCHVEVSSAPFEDAKGFGLQSVLLDITERKQAEMALKASEQRFRNLFETAPVPYAMFEKSGKTLAINRRFSEMFGYALEEIPTVETWMDLSCPDAEMRQKAQQFWESLIHSEKEDGSATLGKETRLILCKDGAKRTVELSVLAEGQRVLATFFDLTDRLREEEARRRGEERMIQSQRLEALGVLVAGVAHNFNNIMAIIMGTASIQAQVVTDPAQREALRIIDTACQRGRGLVRSLTHFSRPSLSNQVPIELNALLDELRLLLGNTARKNIFIQERFSDEPTWILGDPGSLSSALMNLCLNSLDAMPNGGSLTLRTSIPQRDLVDVSVVDTGEGMAPEILAHVTEPFFTTKPVDKGTGLGLSIAHGVIKAHGGTMDIASTPGRGTQINLRFPRHFTPSETSIAAGSPKPLGLASVLVVDDEEDVREMLARMLVMVGAEKVKTVASGQEAVDDLRSGHVPNLVILDHNMPGMDGVQTLALIRTDHPDLPVILSSGEPEVHEWAVFNQANVAVILKPFTLDELLKKLAELGIGLESTAIPSKA